MLEEQENLLYDRQRVALDHSRAFHASVRDFLTVTTPRMDPNHPDEQLQGIGDDDGLVPMVDTRPVGKKDLVRADIYASYCQPRSRSLLATGTGKPHDRAVQDRAGKPTVK